MKIGLISDTHFNNWSTFGQCHDNQISKRLLQQKENFLQAISIFNKEKVDCIIFGGDWSHKVGEISNEVLNLSKDILDTLTIPILFTCGNHDTPVRINPHEHHLLTNVLRGFQPNSFEIEGKVLLINYQDEIDYDKVKNYDLVVVHKMPIGAKQNNYTLSGDVNWRKLAAQNKFVAFGHIHQMQKLSENCFIIGSPMHLHFGDEGKRGVWIVDTDSNKLDFHKLDYPEFIVVDSEDKIKNDGNYYKLLGSKVKIDNNNVVSVVVPKVFDERIKAQDFGGIVREWLAINNKDDSYLELVKDILDNKLSLVKNFYKGQLNHVSVKDFLSIGNVEYDVPQNGFVLVTGDNSTFDSNGAGKSSILGEAICWGLFGETTKGLTGDDVIRNRPVKMDDCCVKLTLKLNEGRVLVTRSRRKGLELYNVTGNTLQPLASGLLQKDIQNMLEDSILGFNKSVFSASVYFSQENLLMLTQLSDSEKTDMITNLLGFESYDDLEEQIRAKVTVIEKDIKCRLEDKIRLEKEIAVNKSEVVSIQNAINDINRKIVDFTSTINSYKSKLSELAGQDTLTEQKVELVDYTYLLQQASSNELDLSIKLTSAREKYNIVTEQKIDILSKVQKCTYEINNKKLDIKHIENEIERLKTLVTDVKCDKCGSLITSSNVELFIQEHLCKLTILNDELSILESNAHSEEVVKDEIDNSLYILSENIQKIQSDITELNLEVSKLHNEERAQNNREQKRLLDNQRIKSEIDKYTTLVNTHNDRLSEFKHDLHVYDVNKISLLNTLKLNESTLSTIDELIVKLHESIDKLGFWKIAFSSKGIRSVLLDKFCNEINATVNDYLSLISNGTMSIIITPTKITKGGEERNKIGMSIQLDGNEVKYQSLSGGEKRRVDISLCFGLNKWVSSKYQVPFGILGLLILDETFSFLDQSGAESVASLLHDESQDRAIFVIDHALSLGSYASNVWTVRKENGISTLEIK